MEARRNRVKEKARVVEEMRKQLEVGGVNCSIIRYSVCMQRA